MQTYIILEDPEEPEEIRVPTTRNVSEVVLELFDRLPIEDLWVASGLTNEPHAWYVRQGSQVIWHARVKSRRNPRPVRVGQSSNANQWIEVGVLTLPGRPAIDSPTSPADIPDYLLPDENEPISKWDRIKIEAALKRALGPDHRWWKAEEKCTGAIPF